MDSAGSVGCFCSGLIRLLGEVTQGTGLALLRTSVLHTLGFLPIPKSRSCYLRSR